MSITHLYLSPHLDDVALSCGGTIWKQTQAGQRVTVINILAGISDYTQLSAFAQEKHAVWGSPEDVVGARRVEDRAALARLGADVACWDYLDAIYRLDDKRVLYPDEASIFGEVDPTDRALQDRLTLDVEAVLDEVGDAMCYTPLAIGQHVDHQIVRDVGLALLDRGQRIKFYEDFPYVWWHRRGEAGRHFGWAQCRPVSPLPGSWRSTVRGIDVEPKISAIARYESQIPDLFGSEEAMAEAVRAYAQMVGGDQHGERFWHLMPTNDEGRIAKLSSY